MKIKISVSIFVASMLALIALSQIKRAPFAPAADFPREALVYVQIADLPALVRLWNESEFKGKYLAGQSFENFKNRHLALKLASRWQEFNGAAGFPLDLEALSALTENRAAVALYDIGKLEFVFIAPVSEQIFVATKFFHNRNKFAEETLADGAIVYRAPVEADRGRQKQELIFAAVKGRFVLATSEKLLARTLANINGQSGNNSLADEPAFKALSEKIEPQAATVWVNQAALNEDYYFKRYWLMSETAELEKIRAGIFDFQIEAGKLIERRKFLLNQTINQPPIEIARAEKLLAHLPPDVPFYHLQTARGQTIDDAVRDTILVRWKISAETKIKSHYYRSSFTDFEDFSASDFTVLSERFDEAIDELEDDDSGIKNSAPDIDFANLLQPASPRTVLTFTEPKVAPAPLFTEFRRGAIFSLAAPARFNRDLFEAAIEQSVSSKVMILAAGAKLRWETKTDDAVSWREMNLPMLGWKVVYALRGDELIVANNTDFLREPMTARHAPQNENPLPPLTELTVINFEQKARAYGQVFDFLAEKKAALDFFTGDVGGLLDSISAVRQIEVKRSYAGNFLNEEVTINFQAAQLKK